MGWMSKLIERHNKKAKCLICDSIVGDDAAIVKYSYDGGVDQAFICKKCGDDMNQNKLEDDIDDAI